MSSPGSWRRMEGGTIWTDEKLDGIPAGTLVCFLPPLNRGFDEADARLIAAAPELLAAVKRAQEWIDQALQAFEGHPAPSETEGKVLDIALASLIRRVEEGP